MLTHIAQTTAVIVPISTEGLMYPVRMIRFVWRRTEPGFIIQFWWNLHHRQVGFAYPVKFPVEAGMPANGHRQRPAQQSAFHQFLDRLYGGTHPIKIISEAEPGIQPEDA